MNKDYGMKLGHVIYNKEEKRVQVTQKIGELDVKEVVDSVKEAEMAAAIPYKDKLETVDKTIASMEILKTKLEAVRQSASKMSNRISSFGFPPPNVFNGKQILTPGTQDVSCYLSEFATVGSFNFTVNQLASGDMRKFTITAANIDTALGLNGSFTLGTAVPGTTATINITPTMTLAQLQQTISNLSSTTSINADLVEKSVGAAGYTFELKLKAQNTGQSIVVNNTVGTPLQSLGMAALPSNYLAGISHASAVGNNEATPLGLTGTLDVYSSGGSAAPPLNITSGMALTDIIAAINAQTSTTGIFANFDYVYTDPTHTNPSSFQLKLTTVNPTTGLPDETQTISASDSGGILSALGLNSPVTDYETLVANVTCDGTTYLNQSNIIDGDTPGVSIVPGVTITLLNASKKSFTATVSTDTSKFMGVFSDFLDSYNDLVRFYKEKTKMNFEKDEWGNNGGKAAEDAELFGNRFVQNVFLDLKAALTGQVNGVSPNFSYITQLGYRYHNDGTIDTPTPNDIMKFYRAVENNFTNIQQLFSNTITMDTPGFYVNSLPDELVTKFQGVPMVVTLTNTSGVVSGTVVANGKTYNAAIASTANTYTMTFDPNSDLAGLELSYLGAVNPGTPVTLNLKMTQGIMAQLDSQIGKILDPTFDNLDDSSTVAKGGYYREVDNLKTEKDKNKVKIEKIKKQADHKGQVMEKEFSKVYQATVQLESIMMMIDAYNNVNN